MRNFVIEKMDPMPVSIFYEDVTPDDLVTREQIVIECPASPLPSEMVHQTEHDYILKFYKKPEFLLIGWKLWFSLGFEMSKFKYPLKLTEFHGYDIIVDTEEETLRFIPKKEHIWYHVS